MSNGFTCIDNAIILNPDLSHGAFRCYAVLRYHARQADFAFPGEERLAEELGVTPRTVRNYLKELERHGLIWREKNVYFFGEPDVKNISETRKNISRNGKNISENPGKNFPIEEKEKEEEKAAAAPARPNLYALFEQNIHLLTPLAADHIQDWGRDYSEAWVDAAIRTAAYRGKRTLSYIAGILKSWQANGFNPPAEILLREAVTTQPEQSPKADCERCAGSGYIWTEVLNLDGSVQEAGNVKCSCWSALPQVAAAAD